MKDYFLYTIVPLECLHEPTVAPLWIIRADFEQISPGSPEEVIQYLRVRSTTRARQPHRFHVEPVDRRAAV